MIANNSITGELALSNPKEVWLTTLYLLGANTTVPSANWLSEHFGFKAMFIIGIVVFSAGSLLAAVASNFWMIALARFAEGLGAGFIFPVGLAILAQNLPKESLALGFNLYIGAAFGGGLAIGLPLAGYLTQFHSWREAFLLAAILGALVAVATWAVQREHRPGVKERFDFFGFLAFVTFIASLLIGLTYGPIRSTDEGWRSPWIIGCFVTALASLLVTLWIEKRHPKPVMPLELLGNPGFAVGAATVFLLGTSVFASATISIDYMVNALQYEKYVSSKIGLSYGSTLALSSAFANFAIKKVPVPVLTFSGLTLLVGSYFLNNIIDHNTGLQQLSWIMALRGTGLGLALGPTTIQAMRAVPEHLATTAAVLLTFFRQVGGTYAGAMIGILTVRRAIFHTARFSEPVNEQLPGYRDAFGRIANRFYSEVSGEQSMHQAKIALVKNIENQAYIQALNDALIFLGYITIAVGLILLIINLRDWYNIKPLESKDG
ncbi:MAG: hypothetical protein RL235_467 [Chlamydiota bacterium]